MSAPTVLALRCPRHFDTRPPFGRAPRWRITAKNLMPLATQYHRLRIAADAQPADSTGLNGSAVRTGADLLPGVRGTNAPILSIRPALPSSFPQVSDI